MQILSNNQNQFQFFQKNKKRYWNACTRAWAIKAIARQTAFNLRTVENLLLNLCKKLHAVDSIHLVTLPHPAGERELVNHPGLLMRENCVLHQRMKGIPLREIAHGKGFIYLTGRKHIENLRTKISATSMRRATALILQLTQEKSSNETEA